MLTLTPGEPCLTYVGLSRVTTIDGLYITDRCESKIAVNPAVNPAVKILSSLDIQFAKTKMALRLLLSDSGENPKCDNHVGVYCSPKVPAVSQMCLALMQILTLYSDFCVFIGDFNVNFCYN